MNNKLFRIDFSDLPPISDRIIRFKQFLTKSAFPDDDEVKNCLRFVADPGLIFESFDQIKKEKIYSDLYGIIIENLWAFGKSDEIESFVVLIDKAALTACVQLEDRGADENKYFAAIKSNTWHKDQFNSFQQYIFLKLCAIWIDNYKSTGTPANTKQDIFGKLCDDESRSIGNSIGFQMPTLSFSGIWINKKIDPPKQIQQSSQDRTIMIDTKTKSKEGTTNKLQWKKQVPLLVYLLHVLRENNIIAGDEWGVNLSKIFVDKNYKEIKNTTINDYKQRMKNIGTTPHNKETIDTIVALIKEIDNELKSS